MISNPVEIAPWANMTRGEAIGKDVTVPPGDINITIIIGEKSNACPRSETSDADTPRNLHNVVLHLKRRCRECNNNQYCPNLIADIGTPTFESWEEGTRTLTIRLKYNRK